MALTNRDIIISPNNGQSTEPNIVFKSGDSSLNGSNITLRSINYGSNGALSFEGSSGQLFSITDSMTGNIFSVNDVSGIPSIEVTDTGNIIFARYSGKIGIRTADFSYVYSDNTPLVGSRTDNVLFVNGSIQLLNDNDALVIGRGTSTFLKDEELGFGWGGGFYMTDGTWIRARNNIGILTGGSIQANIFYDNNNTAFYSDPASTSVLNTITVNGASSFNSSQNHYNGHLYYDAYDATGSHYPHFKDGSSASGSKINWRLYTGETNSITHQWSTSNAYFATRVESSSNFRGTIYYDASDTGYYCDPNSWSNFIALRTRLLAVNPNGNTNDSTTGTLSLWSNPDSTTSTLMFKRTDQTFGTHGAVTDQYASYWIMDTTNRGWIFRNTTTGQNIFSVSTNGGITTIGNGGITAGSTYAKLNIDAGANSVTLFRDIDLHGGWAAGEGHAITATHGTGSADMVGQMVFQHDGGSGSRIKWGRLFHSGNQSTYPMELISSGSSAYLQINSGDMRAPVFYDYDDTSYYVDGAGVTNIHHLRVNGDWGNYGIPWNGQITIRGSYPSMQFRSSTSNSVWLRHMDGGGHIYHYYGSGIDTNDWTVKHIMQNDGTFISYGSSRAPIFYDYNDTTYYLDPNTTGLSLLVAGSAKFTGGRIHLRDNSIENSATASDTAEIAVNFYGYNSGTSYHRDFVVYDGKGSLRFKTYGADNYSYAAGSFRAPIFYDSDDTGYYLNPNSTDQTALRIRGGALHGPNPSWGTYLLVGGDGRNNYIDSTTVASVCSTNGNLHLDAASGSNLYLNHYDGSMVYFGSGVSGIVGYVNSSGHAAFPIYYDYNNTGYYCDPDSTSWLNIVGAAGRFYTGYDSGQTNSMSCSNWFRSSGDTGWYNATYGGGIYMTDSTWVRVYNGKQFYNSSIIQSDSSVRAPIFYDANDTGYYLDPNSSSTSLQIAGAIEQGHNYSHPNVEWAASGSSTGEVIFYLPGTTSNYGMVHMVFDYYEYNSPRTATIIIGGHNWSTAWHNYSCNVIGYIDKEVRLGVKDGRFVVVFGGTGSTWNYGCIRLRKVQNSSYYNNQMDLGGNWSVTQTTTESFSWISGDTRELRTPNAFYASGSVYSPIFYDSQDTSFYADPNGTSRFSRLSVGNGGSAWIDMQDSDEGVRYIHNNSSTIGFVANDGSWSFRVGDDGNIWQRNRGWTSDTYLRKDITNSMFPGQTSALSFENQSTFFRFAFNKLAFYEWDGGAGDTFIIDGGYCYSPTSFRAPIFYDSNDTSYYADPNSTSNFYRLTLAGRSLGSSHTLDLSGLDSSTYYPVTIQIPVNRTTTLRIENALNSNAPSWSTHPSGFSVYIEWVSNGFGWGTIPVSRIVKDWRESFTNVTIVGGLTQMGYSNIEVIFLRGGGRYYFSADADVTPSIQTSTYTVNSQSVAPSTSIQNDVWSSSQHMQKDGRLRMSYGISAGNSSTTPLATLHLAGSTPTGIGSLPGSVQGIIDSSSHNYLLFRNTADNGTYSGIAMQDNNIGGYVVFGNAGAGDSMYIAGYGGGQLQYGTADSINPSARTTVASWNSTGLQVNSGDLRASIFYDSNDTSYYVNPQDWCRMWGVTSYYYKNNHAVEANHQFGVYYGNGLATEYAIYRQSGEWTHPYPDLHIGFHTGIKMGAYSGYDGMRFYSNSDMATLLFQINGGSYYFYKYAWMKTDNSGYYSDTNSWHIQPNDISSYGGTAIRGSRNGWRGIHFYDGGYTPTIMLDGSGNGGLYFESSGRWADYYHYGNNSWGFGSSTTSSSYMIYSSGSIYSTGNIVAYSDRRKKENIVTVDNALDKVERIRGVYYNKLNTPEKREIGVIAQEIIDILPEVVTYDNDNDQYGVSYGNITGLLIEAVKELAAEVKMLKQKLEEK